MLLPLLSCYFQVLEIFVGLVGVVEQNVDIVAVAVQSLINFSELAGIAHLLFAWLWIGFGFRFVVPLGRVERFHWQRQIEL